MANNYLQFSEVIDDITPEESKWAVARLTEMTDKFRDTFEDGWDFQWDVHSEHDVHNKPHIWVYAEEGGEPSHVADFFQEFLKKFRPNESLSLTWASYCSKLRVGEFDGGGFFATAKDVKWFSAHSLIDDAREKFKKGLKKKGKKK